MKNSQSLVSRPLAYDDALITSFSRFGEADCIVKLFTRHSGRMSAFFKGGLAPHRRGQGGGMVSLSLARIGMLAGSEQRMARLGTIDPDPRCLLLASSLKLFAYSSYIAELIEKLMPEFEEAEPIFELILETHDALLALGPQSFVLRAFELKLLEYLGYLPEIPQKLDAETNYFYDPLACCFTNDPTHNSFEVSKKALILARALLAGPLENCADASKDELMMVARIFHSRLKLLGLLPLKSMAFFKRMSQH
jgi:DNA repair protein RecO